MTKPLIMLGAGGHAAVLAELLLSQGRQLIAMVSPEPASENSPLARIPRLMSDESLLSAYSSEQVDLVNGLGSLPSTALRWKLFEYFFNHGYHFATVISPHAILSNYAKLAEGVQLMAGAIVQTNASVGVNSIINTGAIVEHDCVIGAHNHIAPGATLSGAVNTGRRVHIGTGANVIQGIYIGEQAVVGAGATIVRDIPAQQIIIPASSRIIS